jgi:hypothetical protein
MAGFNIDLELGRIARGPDTRQSKKLMRSIKEIYSGRPRTVANRLSYTCECSTEATNQSFMECEAPQSRHLVIGNWVAQRGQRPRV